jgi:chemotaxis protein MotB
MGMKRVVMAFMADQLGDIASNVEVNSDSAAFEIPDEFLFEKGSAKPNGKFPMVMEKLKGVVAGVEDSTVDVTSVVYYQAVADPARAKPVAGERLDLVKARVESDIVARDVEVTGKSVARARGPKEAPSASGYIRFEVKQKERLTDGRKPRPLADDVFGSKDAKADVYDNFVKQISAQGKRGKLDKGGRAAKAPQKAPEKQPEPAGPAGEATRQE